MNLLEYQKNLEKREIKPINLIQVEDEYILKNFMEKLSSLYQVKTLWGDEINKKEILTALSEGEIFQRGKRAIFIKKGESLLKSAKDGAYLVSIAKRVKGTAIFIVLTEKLRKDQLQKEPYKSILSVGDFLEAKVPDKKKIRELVKNRFLKEGINIEDQALDYLLEATSYNLMELRNEVDKLLLYGKDKGNISLEDVKLLCVSNPEYNIFDFLDAFFNKDLDKSLSSLDALYRMGILPLQIQAVLASYALKLYVLLEDSTDKTFSELGIANPFLKNNFKRYVEKFNKKDIKMLINRLHTLDFLEKVYFADPQESFKKFVIEYLRYANR